MKKAHWFISSKVRKWVSWIFILSVIAMTMGRKPLPIPLQRKPEGAVSVLTANVGNLSFGCRDVLYNLCYKDVEERIAGNIRNLKPDIVTVQEILTPWQCKNIHTRNRNKVCFDKDQKTPQIRRLLGDGYTIVCTDRKLEGRGFECIAVKIEFGNIDGCQTGGLCYSARTSKEIIDCDNGFTVSAATIVMKNGFVFDVVNFHPQSTDDACRAKMISQAFEGFEENAPLIQQSNVILMGDFNFDPWRDHDESTQAWQRFFKNGWNNRPFTYHSGIAEKDPPYLTSSLFYRKRTVDFIVSNFAQGVCTVLGESPDTTRLDGGSGTDHRALFGFLWFPKEARA